MKFRSPFFYVLVLGFALASVAVAKPPVHKPKPVVPADVSNLNISSPADGVVVSPGEVIHVEVVPLNGADLKHVVVFGDSLFGIVQSSTGPPFYLNVTVPAKYISAGKKYKLTAQGSAAAQSLGYSLPISLDLEPAEQPVALNPRPKAFYFPKLGDHAHLKITGKGPDKSLLDLTDSTKIVFSTSDPTIVIITRAGLVTATGPGTAILSAVFGTATVTVPVTVPATATPLLIKPATPVIPAKSATPAKKSS